ncbi:MAG: trypsin-like peptidase domain-containing protein [Planctomycetota bacterium]|nr:trypsin-like peptidase domain-containing protein [Planctomycetota bacterium]
MKTIFTKCAIFTLMGWISVTSWAQEESLEIQPGLQAIFAEGSPTSIDDLRAMQEHVVKLTQKVMPAVVGVRVGGASGSGVIISEDGYVLTAGHVVQRPGMNCKIILPDGTMLDGKTLGMQTSRDSGLMKITDKNKKGPFPYLEMGNSKDVKRGQWIIALGHPGGYDKKRTPPLRVGRVYAKPRTNGMIQTDCVLVGGDSGGPLFDMNGDVIGIHSRINPSRRDGQFVGNFHVPVDVYSETWDQLAKGENIGARTSKRPVLGFSPDLDSIAPKIKELKKDGPAEKAGFQKGDVILEFAGKKVRTKEALRIALSGKKKGEKIKVKVRRGDKELELTIELG